LRNIGVPIAHTLISFTSLLKGLDKLIINEKVIASDLEDNSMVIAEAIQTVLRREGIDDAYEKLKEFSRSNEKLNGEAFHQFIDELNVSESIKIELKAITPGSYTGI
jgi:adenylosuccinate lyase